MRHVRETIAFYERQEMDPLSNAAASLWHALQYTRIKAGHPDTFQVAIPIITCRAGLKKRMFFYAREELVEKGYLDYDKTGGSYHLISLTPEEGIGALPEDPDTVHREAVSEIITETAGEAAGTTECETVNEINETKSSSEINCAPPSAMAMMGYKKAGTLSYMEGCLSHSKKSQGEAAAYTSRYCFINLI
ncbi:hypothetical protein [Bacillus piscicola]|uniref:hypothetical protein n=1 Tax=Bacillus piscicola TaxID=1632684 RepID=UPI001F08D07F|nr:hypothetical protein [Bacillus piscicola]